MKIVNNWIVFEDGDIINLSIDINIQTIEKHFILARNRSYRHYDTNCQFCAQGMEKRTRYIASCIYDSQSLQWEFSADVYRKLKPYLNGESFVNLAITRLGTGISTDYQVEENKKRIQSFNVRASDKYGELTISPCDIWQSALSSLQAQVSKSNYDTWLKDTEGMDFDGYIFVVKTPSSYISDYLQTRLMSLVENALYHEIKQVVKVRFYSVSQFVA